MNGAALDETQRRAQAQFSRQSERYAKGHVLENVNDVAAALALIDIVAPARVLDVACGAGHTGLHLASLGHRVTCADLSPQMLERTCEAAAARGLEIETRQHTAEHLPYDDASFDLVTCRVAPHHFSSPAAFVSEVARVLKPGGRFLLIDGTVHEENSAAANWLNRVEKLRDPSHVRLLSPAEWAALCQAASLRVEHSLIGTKEQPDLEWYFEAAATSPENRLAVRELIAGADSSVRATYN
ncbi:MAG: methyltransferase domain-containing protein, partial [Verrucomicrobiota bacterium]|nr:methyltransferase domain-containing protein [Verrucomicrobiota bacterium]